MSKSRKHTPISGNCGGSEKKDKRIANRRLRKKVRQKIRSGEFDDVFPVVDEVMNKWEMSKDGKHWFGDLKYRQSKYVSYDELMRK